MQIRAYQQSNLDKFGCIYNYNSLKPGWPFIPFYSPTKLFRKQVDYPKTKMYWITDLS